MSRCDRVPLQMPSAVVRSVTTALRQSPSSTISRRIFRRRKSQRGLLARLLANPGFYSVVAEFDCTIVGSNFVDERSTIAGPGRITVDPAVKNRAVGRQLMQNALDRVRQQAFPGYGCFKPRITTARSRSTQDWDSWSERHSLPCKGLHLACTFQVTARGPPLSLI